MAPAPSVHEGSWAAIWFPPECSGNQKKMEIKAQGRRRSSKNYTNEFRTQVVAETRDPTRSLAEVARTHSLNANLVSKWRRNPEQAAASASAPTELFPPVQMASPPIPEPVKSSGLVIECRGVRVRFGQAQRYLSRGVSARRAHAHCRPSDKPDRSAAALEHDHSGIVGR